MTDSISKVFCLVSRMKSKLSNVLSKELYRISKLFNIVHDKKGPTTMDSWHKSVKLLAFSFLIYDLVSKCKFAVLYRLCIKNLNTEQ